VVDLSTEDITSMDDSSVKDMMLEALAAAVTHKPPEQPGKEAAAPDTPVDAPAGTPASSEVPPWEQTPARKKFSPLDFETTLGAGSLDDVKASDFPVFDSDTPEDLSEDSESSSTDLSLSDAGESVDMRIEDSESSESSDPDIGPQVLPSNAGMMLSDEDGDLAFPDHLYGGSEDDSATSGDLTPEQQELADLREFVVTMQERIDKLARAERRADMQRRQLSDEKETLSAQLHAYKDRLISKNDEFEAYRRRAEREREEVVRRETERVARSILPVVDHMELAVASAQSNPSIEGLIQGFDLILSQFHKTLGGLTITPIEVESGTPFDPKLHEAMLREDDPDVPVNTITRPLRTGYMLGDLLLRAARVAVSKGGAEPVASEEAEGTVEPQGDDKPEEPEQDMANEDEGIEDGEPSSVDLGDVTELEIKPLEDTDSEEEDSAEIEPEPDESDSSEQGDR